MHQPLEHRLWKRLSMKEAITCWSRFLTPSRYWENYLQIIFIKTQNIFSCWLFKAYFHWRILPWPRSHFLPEKFCILQLSSQNNKGLSISFCLEDILKTVLKTICGGGQTFVELISQSRNSFCSSWILFSLLHGHGFLQLSQCMSQHVNVCIKFCFLGS